MIFPDGVKLRFLHQAGVELLAPDMDVEFLHGGNWCDLNGAVIKVRDVAGTPVSKNLDGTEC